MLIHHDLYHRLSGSSVETRQKQSVELLQLMVYTAAQTDAQPFINMVFSTTAGQVVFNYYKDRTTLPQDVARANGPEELAQYLQDVHTRYCVKLHVGIQELANIIYLSQPLVCYCETHKIVISIGISQ